MPPSFASLSRAGRAAEMDFRHFDTGRTIAYGVDAATVS